MTVVILDTNVISEPTKPAPSLELARWMERQEADNLYITTISQAEVLMGVHLLPPGKRRSQLAESADRLLAEFRGRILPFEERASREYPRIVLARHRAARPVAQFDAMIAAIARAHNATLATRNAEDFEGCGIQVVNPWAYHKK